MFALVGFLAVFFQVDGDEDELEVGEEGLVEPVVAGGGPAVVLHAVEDAFDHVPPSTGLPCGTSTAGRWRTCSRRPPRCRAGAATDARPS